MTTTGTEIAAFDAVGLAELVHRGAVSAVELAEWAIERIEALNPALNAVVTPMFDRARQRAASASTNAAGSLAGVPYLMKDLAAEVAGVRFTEGSRFLTNHTSTYDSALVTRLEAAGVTILGKTNTPEFGLMPACEPRLFGATRNPWDRNRSTSGSSGGSAAAVASGMVPTAHANDLGGSIRYPASACGLFGLKPTRARNPFGPEYGDVVSGWAVEHTLTRTVRDSAAILDATSGPALGDPYCAPAPSGPFSAEVGADPGRLRIAFTRQTASGELGHPDCLAALDDAAELCASLGHEIEEVDFGTQTGLNGAVGASIGTVFDAAAAWIVEYWIKRIGRQPAADEIEPLTRASWQAGLSVTGPAYLTAVEELQRFSRRVAAFFTTYDIWLTPTMSSPPLLIGEMAQSDDDPFAAAQRGGTTIGYSGVVANITGNPAMSVPLWWNEAGLPIGVHFLGRFGDEASLFRLAAQLETARPWAPRFPVTVR